MGSVAAWFSSRLIATMLFGLTPADPATYATVALGLGAVALLASLLPARRASRIDPIVALANRVRRQLASGSKLWCALPASQAARVDSTTALRIEK